MDPQKIKQIIEQGLPDTHAEIQGDDGTHFTAVVIASPAFVGKPVLARHRMINDLLKPYFDSGELHALALPNTITPEQWEKQQQG